jgi:hypothetical protein
MVWEVETYLLAGQYSKAEELAHQVLAVLGKGKHRGSEAWLKYLLGDISARRDPSLSLQAEARYRNSLDLAQELSMRPLQAHCYFGLGQIHVQTKDARAARSELQIASELYRAMNMPFWLAKADLAITALN